MKNFYNKFKKILLINKKVINKEEEIKPSFIELLKSKAGQNKLYVDEVNFRETEINFYGTNNILYIEKGARISNTTINFLGNNAVVCIKKSRHKFESHINIYNDSVFYLGNNNSVNGKRPIFQLSERRNIFIGNDNMFSFNISFRVADPHLIYSSKTRNRINESKSIYIGDHVWIGQNAKIFKNTRVGSGSIIGGEALVTKQISSNATFGGNPAREIKKDIFWLRPSVHQFTKEDSLKWSKYDDDLFIYKEDKTLAFDQIEEKLLSCGNPDEKLKYLLELPENKNRFFIR